MKADLIPLALGALGAVIALVGGGFGAWGLAALWLLAIGAVAVSRALIRPQPQMNVFTDLVGLVLTGVILAPEGGWWFVPAVVAQFIIDRRSASRPSARTT